MNKRGTIIVVDDNRNVLAALKLLLERVFEEVVTLPSPVTLLRQIEQCRPDVILLDMNFSAGLNTGNEGLFWLREVKRFRPELPVVLFTAYADIELAVAGMREGAADFVVKPWDNDRLVAALTRVCQTGKTSSKSSDGMVSSLFWGVSASMQELRMMVEKIAPTDAAILITGENGTGKTLLAKEIHRLSARHGKPFVTVDLGALSETLFESELFGHVKGAFTDAKTDRAGKIEEADSGTLFLDEIGNLPFPQQAKMLTVLQNRTITRVGSNKSVPVDFRLVCATNRKLDEKVMRGEFREDLYYRVNTIHLEIPPLRNRRDDILPFAKRFVEIFTEKYHKSGLKLSSEAVRKLMEHPWYGNIRELEHVVEHAVIVSEGGELQARDFRLTTPIAMDNAHEITTLEEMEAEMIRKCITQCGGNLTAVAATLGITRQTLYNKMKKYGI
ncbi:MAG: sigma-54-dependent Fis family transcriptional regulator [Bacteroidales bacterium]|nr:sigma-54-dependent Fis family transcriptional regulator [Bacteroidales bacterium]